jgi:hypothetical protein
MGDIGSKLRDARVRAKIDISEVEQQTKIRAKYLRALEDEEWELLPGPTYVRSFLRTYAEFLGLDGRLLVEEYRLRHEQWLQGEARPLSPLGVERRRDRPRRRLSPGLVLGLVVVTLVAALGVIGQLSGKDPATKPAAPQRGRVAAPAAERTAPRTVVVGLVGRGSTRVCLVDAAGRRRVDGRRLRRGERTARFRSTRFRLAVSNGQAALRVDRRTVGLPRRGGALEVTASGAVRRLPASRGPRCP